MQAFEPDRIDDPIYKADTNPNTAGNTTCRLLSTIVAAAASDGRMLNKENNEIEAPSQMPIAPGSKGKAPIVITALFTITKVDNDMSTPRKRNM